MADNIFDSISGTKAGIAAGVGGLGGFIYDRYIRGKKDLKSNLLHGLAFGGGGALAYSAYEVGSNMLRQLKNKPEDIISRNNPGGKDTTIGTTPQSTKGIDLITAEGGKRKYPAPGERLTTKEREREAEINRERNELGDDVALSEAFRVPRWAPEIAAGAVAAANVPQIVRPEYTNRWISSHGTQAILNKIEAKMAEASNAELRAHIDRGGLPEDAKGNAAWGVLKNDKGAVIARGPIAEKLHKATVAREALELARTAEQTAEAKLKAIMGGITPTTPPNVKKDVYNSAVRELRVRNEAQQGRIEAQKNYDAASKEHKQLTKKDPALNAARRTNAVRGAYKTFGTWAALEVVRRLGMLIEDYNRKKWHETL